MTLWTVLWWAFVAFVVWLAWWNFVLYAPRKDVPYGSLSSIPEVLHYKAPIAKLVHWLRGSKPDANTGITLPHPFKRQADCSYSGIFASGPHRRHEAGGHIPELERMGPVNYIVTHLWHSTVVPAWKRYVTKVADHMGGWRDHQMEIEAMEREKHIPDGVFGTIGTPPA